MLEGRAGSECQELSRLNNKRMGQMSITQDSTRDQLLVLMEERRGWVTAQGELGFVGGSPGWP